MISRRKIWCVTAAAALIVRLFFGGFVFFSPYRFYHCVPGLDMETFLRFSDGTSVPPLFVAHRFLLTAIRWLNHGAHCVFALFTVQALCGIVGAVLTADLTLKICRDRCAALFAGLVAALYAPYLIYEFAVLQEALLVNLTLAAVWFLLVARRRRYAVAPTVAAAAVWLFALVGRPAAVLLGIGALVFVLADRRSPRRWIFLFALFSGMAGASVFNFVFSHTWNPFFHVMPYIVSVNAPSPEGTVVWAEIAGRIAAKVPSLFSATEIPENLNFYFLTERFGMLKILPGPEGVLPLAGAGTALLIFHRRFRGRFLLPFAVIALLMIPLAARIPIGRYRLMMTPYFIIPAAFVWTACRKIGRSWLKAAVTVAAVAVSFVLFCILSPARVTARSDDFVAWGIAADAAGKTREAEKFFRLGWRAAANRAAAVRLYALLMRENRGEEALAFTREYLSLRPGDDLFRFYEALSLAVTGRSHEAEIRLDELEKDAGDASVRDRISELKRQMGKEK